MNPNRVSTGKSISQSMRFFLLPRYLLGRLYLLAALGVVEGVLVVGNLRILPAFHTHLFVIATVALGVFLGLGHPWLKAQRENIPFGFMYFGGYLVFLAIGIYFHALMELHGTGFLYSHAAVFVASPLLLFRIPLLLLACIPFRIWVKTLRASSPLPLYALLAGVAAWASEFPIRLLYKESSAGSAHFLQVITFRSVELVLRFFLPGFTSDAATFTLGTPRFSDEIIPSCSGMEGLGLVLLFTSLWLWYSRKETRFPQALLLIPCAMGCIWLLNIVRITTLIVIGDTISPEVAEVGAHSNFGWIAFIVVALAFFLATQKLSWTRKIPSSALSAVGQPRSGGAEIVAGASEQLGEHRGESPAIRAYLVPFLAILAASFVSKAASGYFEWLYPLRFVAAAIVLWYFWPELKKLNWRFGWFGPAAGAAVFLVWMAPSWFALFGSAHQHADSPLGPALAALSPTARWTWIGFRVAAAVITVPIAEELAFRGYLARRLISREFDSVSFNSLTALSISLSSAVFGLEHMKNLMDWQHLALGTLAGLAFAAALRWRGRMGDAVIAHAVSNLLLAAWVLGFGDWAQW